MTTAYPLEWPEGWPRTPDRLRKTGSRFNTTFDSAKREIMDELRKLGAHSVVISSWLPLRNDGYPRADQARRRIEDPGVAVYFSRGIIGKTRQLVIARDAYITVHDNLRSIGLAIEHLRGLERHGGANLMERAFSGFAALPPPEKAVKPWWEVLGCSPDAPEWMIEGAYKHQAKTKHPDRGGTVEEMAELNRAREEGLRTVKAVA